MIVVLALAGCSLISDAELAARFDLDGDGVPRPDDCDDDDANVQGATPGYADVDGDGFGSTAELARCPGAGTDGFATEPGDCDDADASIFPGAPETCNDLDDDCDTVADDGLSVPLWYVDEDGDRFGTTADIVQQCTQPAGYADNPDDCDDADPLVNPDKAWYTDADSDGYGDADAPVHACEQPEGTVPVELVDCDDARADVSPLGTEVCDALDADEDCDGVADDADVGVTTGLSTFYVDADGDGLGDAFAAVEACDLQPGLAVTGDDCDDSDAGIGSGECLWFDVDAGHFASCGIRMDGTLDCWGDPAVVTGVPTTPTAIVSVGSGDACAVSTAGALTCWGTGFVTREAPTSGAFIDVDVTEFFACAVTAAGELTCWGSDTGEDGVPTGGGFASVSVGYHYGCALDAAGFVTCWGDPQCDTGYGQCDAPETAFDDVICGYGATVGLAGGAVSHWGFCESCDSAGTFVQVSGDSVQTHYCGRAADGALTCWGTGNFGETTPPSGAGFTDVSMGYFHACAVDGDGGIQCWGDCSSGECTPPA